jgi:hypothetical protein
MSKELVQAVGAATDKEYKEFEKNITDVLVSRMKTKLADKIAHYEQNIFKEQ